MKFEAASQFNEYILVDRALEYFRIRTKLLKDEIHRMFLLEKNPSNRFQIMIKDEDHTMGEVINYEIQSHDDILKSSISKPDHLIRQIVLEVVSFKENKLLDAIMVSMDNLMVKIDRFEHLFQKLDRPDGSISKSSDKSTDKIPANKSTDKIPANKLEKKVTVKKITKNKK
jgi:DNA-directed RNA polymerase subunit L